MCCVTLVEYTWAFICLNLQNRHIVDRISCRCHMNHRLRVEDIFNHHHPLIPWAWQWSSAYVCGTFASGSYLQSPLLPGPSHSWPLNLLSCTKEMKTFIRKWVFVSHFWQLAGEHLRSPVTFYSYPSSLWLVAPRTFVLLGVLSYKWHSLWALTHRDVCPWVVLVV